jgi:hypothetical protein
MKLNIDKVTFNLESKLRAFNTVTESAASPTLSFHALQPEQTMTAPQFVLVSLYVVCHLGCCFGFRPPKVFPDLHPQFICIVWFPQCNVPLIS